MSGAAALVDRLDRTQQARPWLAFPFAVVKKFFEDQAGNLAALISYYAFFSFFPLLLVLVTVLGFAGSEARDKVQHQITQQFPGLGKTILPGGGQQLHGSGLGLVVGIALALWAGLGVANAAQNGFNTVWQVPIADRPSFLKRTLRSVGLLVVLGVNIVVTTVISGVSSSAGSWLGIGAGSRVLLLAASLVINVILFTLIFRLLTVRDVTTRAVLPGAILAAVGWQILQSVGGYYISNKLSSASSTYGTFAVVIGLLTWFFLLGQLILLATELNVVRSRRFWPRGLAGPPTTDADRRVTIGNARMQRLTDGVTVEVRFDDEAGTGTSG